MTDHGHLSEHAQEYEEILARKDALEAELKATNSVLTKKKEELIGLMVDTDIEGFSSGGYRYSLTPKTKYSKRSAAELDAEGLDFLDVLRDEGLGDIIKETVSPQTLQAAISSLVEANGEMPEGLEAVIKTYEFTDITRRKENRKR